MTGTSDQGQLRALMGKLGRFSKPDQEQSVTWTAGTTIKLPSALKTDKFISAVILRWHGRIAIANANLANSIVDPARNLIQQVRLYGTHVQFGSQRVIVGSAKMFDMVNRTYGINYAPGDVQSAPFATPIAVGNYDCDIVWTIPVFPQPMRMHQVPLYSLKGPDWAGNLYLEMDTGDYTSIGGTVAANVNFHAYGAATGSPVVYVSVIRPLLTVPVMNEISPAICFRTSQYLDGVAQAVNLSAQKIASLNIGKRMAAFTMLAGTLQAGTTAGQRAYSAFLNTIISRWFASLDGKPLVNPYSGVDQNEWAGWLADASVPAGIMATNFIHENMNPDCAFPAETLTSARRFEVWGDLTAAATNGLELLQEEILGSPTVSSAGAAAAVSGQAASSS